MNVVDRYNGTDGCSLRSYDPSETASRDRDTALCYTHAAANRLIDEHLGDSEGGQRKHDASAHQ